MIKRVLLDKCLLYIFASERDHLDPDYVIGALFFQATVDLTGCQQRHSVWTHSYEGIPYRVMVADGLVRITTAEGWRWDDVTSLKFILDADQKPCIVRS